MRIPKAALCSTLLCTAAAALAPTIRTAGAQTASADWRKLADPITPVRAGPLFGPLSPRDGMIGDYPASNVTLMAWLPLSEFPNNQNSGNDCWGYISPSGREYAIYGMQSGFGFVDITDPAAPVQIGFVPGNTSVWRDIKVIGRYAYGVSEGGLGIQVIDLDQADAGVVTHVRNKMQNGHAATHNIAANPDSGYLYLCGANIANGGLIAVSTADPTDPTIVGAWNQAYVHDAQIVSYSTGPYAGREIAFCLSGTNGGWGQTGLRIVDVTNKSNMYTVSTVSWSGARYAHQGWLSEDRRYLFINDELDEGNTVGVTTTRVFDVSNLSNPVFRGTFTSGSACTDHNLYVHAGRLYEANYMSGLRVFDIADPLGPEQIAYFDTAPDRDEPGYHGAWSTFPYFPSGTILISDIERGLFVLRLGEDRLDFTFPDGLPQLIPPGTPAPLRVQIDPAGATLDPDTVTLTLETSQGRAALPMLDQGQGLFAADIPPMECFEPVEYWFAARDTLGRLYTEPLNAPITDRYHTRVATETSTLFEDDFQSDRGWAVDNSQSTSGGWARAAPAAGNAAEPGADADGSGLAFLTGQAPGESLAEGPITLTSPAFDLSQHPLAALHYALWYDVEGSPAAPMFVEVSNDNGSTWTQVAYYAREHAWRTHDFPVADYVTPTNAVRLRFRANNVAELTVVEAGVDEVRLTAPICRDCPADYNQDGRLDATDFLAYLNDFTGSTHHGDPDLNHDGIIDARDFLVFLNLFAAGCD